MKTSLKIIITTFTVLSLFFLFFITNFFSPTALFGLGATSEIQDESQFNEEQPKDHSEERMGELDVGLSFKVLKKTQLSAKLSESYSVSDCPQTTDIVLIVKNLGNFTAEKISIKFPEGFKVIACENCEIGLIYPLQEAKTRAKLCRYDAAGAIVEVNAVNAPLITLPLES